MAELRSPTVSTITVELQWLEHLWNHEIHSRQGEFESVNHSARSGGKIGISFRFSLT